MAILKVVVHDGTTVVTIDDQVVSGLRGFKVYCKGDEGSDGKISMSFSGTPFGAALESGTAEIEMDIDDALAVALKG